MVRTWSPAVNTARRPQRGRELARLACSEMRERLLQKWPAMELAAHGMVITAHSTPGVVTLTIHTHFASAPSPLPSHTHCSITYPLLPSHGVEWAAPPHTHYSTTYPAHPHNTHHHEATLLAPNRARNVTTPYHEMHPHIPAIA